MIYLLCKTGKVDFDETRLLVVRAQSEEEARGIGSEKGSGKAWKLRGEITVEAIHSEGPSETICEDFNAG